MQAMITPEQKAVYAVEKNYEDISVILKQSDENQDLETKHSELMWGI